MYETLKFGKGKLEWSFGFAFLLAFHNSANASTNSNSAYDTCCRPSEANCLESFFIATMAPNFSKLRFLFLSKLE